MYSKFCWVCCVIIYIIIFVSVNSCISCTDVCQLTVSLLCIFLYLESLNLDPDAPSIIGGGVMTMTGPCFSTNIETITCLFTDKVGDVTAFTKKQGGTINTIINGITVNEKAVCPMPLFRRLGSHNVVITLSNGKNYTGNFDVGMFIYNSYVCICS